MRQVTRFNDEWNQISLGNTEFIRYESSDGVEIEGVLLVPPQYRAGTRLPTIMMFHAGRSADGRIALTAWGRCWRLGDMRCSIPTSAVRRDTVTI